jgi:hypothetical protein
VYTDCTSIRSAVRGGDFEANKTKMLEADHETLAALVINTRYNEFVSARDSYDQERPIDPTVANGLAHGKRVPYIGWFWRNTDFCHKRICIGDCGQFIGVMENNKWDYPSRLLTEAEVDQVLAIIDAAMRADEQGGRVSKIEADTHRELERLWPLFQTFQVAR